MHDEEELVVAELASEQGAGEQGAVRHESTDSAGNAPAVGPSVTADATPAAENLGESDGPAARETGTFAAQTESMETKLVDLNDEAIVNAGSIVDSPPASALGSLGAAEIAKPNVTGRDDASAASTYSLRKGETMPDARANNGDSGTAAATSAPITSREEAIERLSQARARILDQLGRIIVGQRLVIDEILITLFSRGHCLLEGVPGLAKTLMISTLARALNLSFSRIQFTPDLMPADITGIDIIEEDRATGSRKYRFLEGPLFSNIVLADEINRTPPKTQAALLEAMQERQVTVGRVRHGLADPFFVLATQNPIEQEGTYPLPEAQQDRFMFKVFVRYPSFDEEFEVARRTTALAEADVEPVLSGAEIDQLQRIVREVPVSDHVIRYTLALVRQTRVDEPGAPDFVREQLSWGAGPRAVQFLILGGKARALLSGRTHVTCTDIASLAKPVLRHRLVLSFMAESEGVMTDDVIQRLVEMTPQREDELSSSPRFRQMFAAS